MFLGVKVLTFNRQVGVMLLLAQGYTDQLVQQRYPISNDILLCMHLDWLKIKYFLAMRYFQSEI